MIKDYNDSAVGILEKQVKYLEREIKNYEDDTEYNINRNKENEEAVNELAQTIQTLKEAIVKLNA